MIKAILIGGGDLDEKTLSRVKEESVTNFSKSNLVKALVIPYARYGECWDEVYKKNTIKYAHQDYQYEFIYPSLNEEEFLAQLNSAEIVILTGGSELGLKENLPNISNSHFDNKTIIATSAGANFLSQLYYSNDRDEIAEGAGILKINTICHCKTDTIDKVEKLVELNKLPTLALREGDFVVVYGTK